jgi:hypothetical protein
MTNKSKTENRNRRIWATLWLIAAHDQATKFLKWTLILRTLLILSARSGVIESTFHQALDSHA